MPALSRIPAAVLAAFFGLGLAEAFAQLQLGPPVPSTPPAARPPQTAPGGQTTPTTPPRPPQPRPAARPATPSDQPAPEQAPQRRALPGDQVAPTADETVIAPPRQRINNRTAVFAGLDKITGRIIVFDVAIDETVQFGALQVTPKVCYTRPPTETPQTTTFVEVDEVQLNGQVRRIFAGWMFAASPGLSSVEHPVYDVWLTDCKQAPPVIPGQPSAQAPAPAATPATPTPAAAQPPAPAAAPAPAGTGPATAPLPATRR